MQNLWHAKSAAAVIEGLRSSERGLSGKEAASRLKQYGLNKLPEAEADGFLIIFLRQFQSPLIYVLIAACIVVFSIGEPMDGAIIIAVLFFNAVVGTVQEGKAQNILLALKKFTETSATVLRDDREMIISDGDVVPGDVLILQEGAKVPADARVFLSHNLKADEASLTGESEPVQKTSEQRTGGDSARQYANMVYKATNIVVGYGRAVVVATGINTVIGIIAGKVAEIDTEISLKKNIRNLSRLIIIVVAAISIAVFALGVYTGNSVREMFATAVAMAVSIVPEGFPIVVTLILAMGVWRMGKRNALVKRLQAVEAIGQAKVIAVDKTGTLTKNEIVIQKVYAGGVMFEIGGTSYDPEGDVSLNGEIVDAANHPDLLFAGKVAAFCSDAQAIYSAEEKKWRISGDPTEAAMLALSRKLGFHKENLEKEFPAVGELPFDYKLKYHAALRRIDGKNLLCVAGAPEAVLSLSQTLLVSGKRQKLDSESKKNMESIFYQMSRDGMRVVAFAVDPDSGGNLVPEKINNLSFAGFYGMRDAIRPEAAAAIRKATAAGIKVVMITGDHSVTAEAIAREVGILRGKGKAITGKEIDKMSDAALLKKLNAISVFARVNPEHKMRIISAYRAAGIIVAMTGDGVNDAPSLVAADLGVAMGRIGTEVAKEASDIVLLDDNLDSIVSAIEEGRSIYKTIKKVILYLFSTSMGEVLVIFSAIALGFPLPILPSQIIWLNFVTDGFLTVSLAMEPKERNLLDDNFEKPKKYLIDKLMAKRMVFMSLIMALGTLFLFIEYYGAGSAKAWTVSLTALAVFQWFNAWNCRAENKSALKSNLFSNKFLVAATGTVILLQLCAVYTPLMQKFLHTIPLDFSDWMRIVPIAASVILAEEIRKWFARRRKKRV